MNNHMNYFRVAKVTYLFTTGVILAVMLFFTPTFSKLESTGDNLFTVSINGTVVGTCQDVEAAQELVTKARSELAEESDEMLYIPVDIEAEGQEVLIGQVDSEKLLYQNIKKVLAASVRKTLKHAYTVKINEYMVNLADSEDVIALLQAALERYDTEGKYQVNLIVDPKRQLNVLTTSITQKGEEDSAREQDDGAGIAEYFEEVFTEIEPDVEKSNFSSLDYGLVDIQFGDTVEIVDAYLTENEITPLETAIAEVTADQEKEQIYEVKSGDTLSQIAEDNGLPMDELIAINPTLENERSMIRVGDELIITIPEPELSVIHSECIYEEDSYEADIVYVDNDSWYTNQTKVLQQPSAGFRKAAAVVTYRNDMVVSEEILKEDVVYEAVPKIVERGTKVPPTFIKPISGGRLSSAFGRRSAPTKGASTYHKGVDWATPTGTAVMASCGGTVTRAGWASGYGYVVYIRHEGGRETRYGHLSKVLVSVGQKVSQGQKIALSGNTGRSTGPHLHFEILINATAVDPYKYMS
ncbi:MAG: M23 family metallopeptidase [Lachnospiraceae bacterium]|nr:M23 family metallopeptidase [Lachnospiraceae bacterium]